MNRRNEWRKMQVILDPDIVRGLYEWHGGQSSALYSLASTGDENLVSLSMIDAGLDELRSTYRRGKSRELSELINDLSSVRLYWREFSAENAGMLVERDPAKFYEYDKADRGMDAEEEAEMVTKGEWANPRKAMAPIRKRRK